MAAHSESSSSIFDSVKLFISLVLVIGAIAGFYYFSEQSLLYRILGIVAMSIVSIGIALTTESGQTLWGFFKGARNEIRKVVWPTRQETVQTTLIVMVMVTIVGLFLWLLDMFFLWGVRLLTGQVA